VNKMLSRFLSVLSWVWIVGAGFLFYRAAVHPEAAVGFIQSAKGAALLGLVSTLMLITAILAPFARMAAFRRRKEIHYANAIGEISISLAAIEEALERVLDGIETVRSYEVSLADNPTDKKLTVHARLSLWEVNDIPTKIAEIQQELKNRFEEIMPEAESVEYKVTLASFIPHAKKKTKKAPSEPAYDSSTTEETDYFTGIKYPVPEDEEE